MKVVQLISWEGDRPVWILDSGLLSRAERVEVTNFIASLEPDKRTDLTTLSFPIEIGEGRASRSLNLQTYFRGLDISKNDPSKGYFLSQLLLGTESQEIDPDADLWSDERHDREIDIENERRRGNNLASRLVLLRGSVFLANRAPIDKGEEEQLFLLAEYQLNEKAIKLQILRSRLERQRKILALGVRSTQKQRRTLPDELISFVLERDQVCQECGSDEDLQLDHIIPVSRGGNDSEENLRLLCGTCNRKRGDLRNA